MKAMIRPLESWLSLVRHLVGAVPEQDKYFVERMRARLHNGDMPTEAEAIRIETLAEKYRAAI